MQVLRVQQVAILQLSYGVAQQVYRIHIAPAGQRFFGRVGVQHAGDIFGFGLHVGAYDRLVAADVFGVKQLPRLAALGKLVQRQRLVKVANNVTAQVFVAGASDAFAIGLHRFGVFIGREHQQHIRLTVFCVVQHARKVGAAKQQFACHIAQRIAKRGAVPVIFGQL